MTDISDHLFLVIAEQLRERLGPDNDLIKIIKIDKMGGLNIHARGRDHRRELRPDQGDEQWQRQRQRRTSSL